MINKKTLRLAGLVIVLFLAIVVLFNKTAMGQKEKLAAYRLFNRLTYRVDTSLSLLTASKESITQLDIPLHYQEHSLSCEVAALKMALNYLGVTITESELIKNLPFDNTGNLSSNNIWGDPEKGFVGSIDGKMPKSGYGVYETPIANLASKYRKALPLEKANLTEILQAVFEKKAVIVWGYTGSGVPITWKTDDGREIKAVFGEHVRVISGFSGTVANPSNIWLLDPIYGKIRMSKDQFLKNWATLDNRAVIVYQ